MKTSPKSDRKEENMPNMNRLRGLIVEKGFTIEKLADEAQIPKVTLYRRIKEGGTTFRLSEVERIETALGLTQEETADIFLS